ncbi:MAG TPA: SDR family oxidoreductase [Bryobacteraceae bacterium]|jgi:3-oxoacyl-[acyl-carrier protein] reductase|nr:SDR family oxidoreductase [Bryobacteraceae bacterium]
MDDRSALITGVAGEIGGHLANDLLKEGWIVCGLDQKIPRDSDRAQFSFQECDLSDAAETERKIDVFHRRFGAFDAVINCAGLIANSPLLSFVEGRLVHHDFELWGRVLSSCLSSAFYVTACTALKMAEARKRGVVVNFSSVCSRGNPGQAAYSAAKAGLNGLTSALARELGTLGIRVVAVAPGYIDTVSTREHVSAAKLKEIKASVPLKRLGKMEEVILAVKFILANEYVNGTVIELDGGQVL